MNNVCVSLLIPTLGSSKDGIEILRLDGGLVVDWRRLPEQAPKQIWSERFSVVEQRDGQFGVRDRE